MVEFLALQVLLGKLEREKVPARYRDAVLARLAELEAVPGE